MTTTTSTSKCAASRRCRQPLAFSVDLNSWRSLVCEKHLGILCARKGSPDEGLLVRRLNRLEPAE